MFAVSSGAARWDECCGGTLPLIQTARGGGPGSYELICLDYCHSVKGRVSHGCHVRSGR